MQLKYISRKFKNFSKFIKKHTNLIISLIGSFVIGYIFYLLTPESKPNLRPYFILDTIPSMVLLPFDPESKTPIKKDFDNQIFLTPTKDSTNTLKFDLSNKQSKKYIIETPMDTSVIELKSNFNVKFKNKGSSSTELFCLVLEYNLSSDEYLRNVVYNGDIIIDTNVGFTDNKRVIFPDSAVDLFIPEMIVPALTDSLLNEINLHILLIYKDGDDNYFDTYFKIRYKLFNPLVYFYTIVQAVKVREHMTEIQFIRKQYPPRKLLIEDYMKFMNSTYSLLHILTPDERDHILKAVD